MDEENKVEKHNKYYTNGFLKFIDIIIGFIAGSIYWVVFSWLIINYFDRIFTLQNFNQNAPIFVAIASIIPIITAIIIKKHSNRNFISIGVIIISIPAIFTIITYLLAFGACMLNNNIYY